MTQQPFSRPGAVDLSGLQRPAPADGQASAAGSSAYSLEVDEQSFQSLLESSVTAPVVLVFYSPSRAPESTTYALEVAAATEAYEGRFLAGLVDIDATPSIAASLQIPQVPLLMVILDGRPAAQPIPGVLRRDELDALLNQLAQGLTTQGITARHQPLSHPASADDEGGEPQADPRYAPAEQALASGDVDAAVAEYQRLVDANPADTEAAAGLAMAKVLQRTQGVDADAARAAAVADPDDVGAQTLASDVDLLDGDVDSSFDRLVDLVRRSSGDERNQAREHLIGLFAAVGNDDPRVLRGRQSLASALF
ncbi:MAG TPA: tetratricopeptide repeat protein [Nocardioides sp.]|uniref:tetratricopeptide repeat protein n=1 Tax=Nocardioides sp. TaxID=35761 RepID=UPI002E31C9AA|nr:tetratricopeptide repeat protein [Nocardioides sp.]HEX3932778.1 tetratricopeptide repeat protein [Nocardioides sp.]